MVHRIEPTSPRRGELIQHHGLETGIDVGEEHVLRVAVTGGQLGWKSCEDVDLQIQRVALVHSS